MEEDVAENGSLFFFSESIDLIRDTIGEMDRGCFASQTCAGIVG